VVAGAPARGPPGRGLSSVLAQARRPDRRGLETWTGWSHGKIVSVLPPFPVQRKLFTEVWLNGRLDENLDAVYQDGLEAAEPFGLGDGAPLTYTKLAMARAAGRTSRAGGRGGGSAAPGRLLLRMAPGAIKTLARRLRGGITLISSTNGKTTTARMLAEILKADGRVVVHNRAGANTHWGVSTALAEDDGDTGVFEVDEAWLPLLAGELRPGLVVMGNLFRDRLDAYGELDRLVTLWRALLRSSVAPEAVVANADDPVLAGAGGVLSGASATPILFGVADVGVGRLAPEHPHEGHTCAGCGAPLRYERAFVGQLGHYSCLRCGSSRPVPSIRALDVQEEGLDAVRATITHPTGTFSVRLGLPGLHNVYNALAATAAALQLGVSPDSIRLGLQSVRPPFGRGETIVVQGRTVQLLLVKNPVGMNETLRLLRGESRRGRLHLWLALNDGAADGRDVSWIWDADFERLSGCVEHAVCSGRRAAALALRLKYAGWDCPLEVDENLDASLQSALAQAPGKLILMPTYTALLDLRGALNRRGVAVSDWGLSARAAV
jgi:UDP-N-acetylmuramyl tripeptide synthase